MLIDTSTPFQAPLSPSQQAIADASKADEQTCVKRLIHDAALSPNQLKTIATSATKLVEGARATRLKKSGLDAFMMQYDLSSEEGIILMCLAEALLRIPDKHTADKLIRDKITQGDWEEHLGQSNSLFVNAATWGLMLTGKMINTPFTVEKKAKSTVHGLVKRQSAPVIRQATIQAMRVLGKQFVLGQTIQAGLKRARKQEAKGYRYSYDMLGEAAKTDHDAKGYLAAYVSAIHAIGKHSSTGSFIEKPGISIKLSALHPRYEVAKAASVMDVLYPRLVELVLLAQSYDIGLTIDAEEADRLELSLILIEKLAKEKRFLNWQGLGLAIQAYQKRAPFVIDHLVALSQQTGRRFMIRLVKGAYWDAEIKHAQVEGYSNYPVYTRKVYTDVSYLACAKKLLHHNAECYPQFATHNAHTVAAIMALAGKSRDFEFQCLHGMGDALYDQIVGKDALDIPCRIYAPVGSHEHLLAYLVRRLLENGANSSFVNRLVDANTPIASLIEDPVSKASALQGMPHPKIPLPGNLFGQTRKNARGIDLTDHQTLLSLNTALASMTKKTFCATPTAQQPTGDQLAIVNPADTRDVIGHGYHADESMVLNAFDNASKAFKDWDQRGILERAGLIERAADLLEKNTTELMYLAIKEAGKTINNAVAEIREAVDFCRYYASYAREHYAQPLVLPGPTGEQNELSLHGRGVFVCISPWNFPLAIFLGQVSAALVMGNTVIAKPAEQTPLIASAMVDLLHQAGIPKTVVQLLPGKGDTVGQALVNHHDVAGVMFTGSTEVAKAISRTLANKPGPIVPLIAETGGQNAMIVDSSALPEQVVTDIMLSAFDSAGQRCSALRVLCVQDDVADIILPMLEGAMQTLVIGDPSRLNTDVGPVIDHDAKNNLNAHIQAMKKAGKTIYQACAEKHTEQGTFVLPTLIHLNHFSELSREQFGPILHVIRFKANALPQLVADINHSGYGLTFGIHSRINETIRYLTQHIQAGNLYVNRNMVGAVVGVQPFGGEGLSGTGPKAGGPHYLSRLAIERTISVDTTASGGNASLMSLNADDALI